MKFSNTKTILFIAIILLNGFIVFSQENILDKKISVSINNIPLKEALSKIEKQSGVSFAYNDVPALNKKVTAKFTDQKISNVLDALFENTTLAYKVIAGKISIYEASKKKTEQTIHGYIYDKNTGEALIGATVYDAKTYKGTLSNQFGFFSLTLPPGNYELTISFLGYKNQILNFSTDANLVINMVPESRSIEEVAITAKRNDDFITSSGLGNISLASKNIKAIPSLGGEADMLKSITLLPGVKQGIDGSAGFYVRGGGPDQNLILLDGVPLYNPYHLWGYLSTFNADAINNVEVTKGAFPARYGGRLSSVVDVSMNDGNNQEWEKKISAGLLSGKASISGPLKKDTSSLFLSVRRTYADLLIAPLYALEKSLNNSKTKTGYNFTDVNLKTNYRFSEKNRLFLSAYYSKDKLYNNKIESADSPVKYEDKFKHSEGWGNAIVALRWNHLFSEKIFVNTSAYYSGYNYYTLDDNKVTSNDPEEIPEMDNLIRYYSNINDFSIKQDYQFYMNDKQSLQFGAGVISHLYEPGVNTFDSKTSEAQIDSKIANSNIRATELFTYLEDDIEIFSFIKINAGLHASGFSVQDTSYVSFQPRISGRIKIGQNFSIKAGYSETTQYQHLLTTSSITQSSDLWVPATKKISPQDAKQYAAGVALLINKNYQFEVEGYSKTMNNLITYKEGYEFMDEDLPWEEKVTVGKGESQGVEFLLRKLQGNLTGWIGYTLSRTTRQFDEINLGKKYPYKFDRRHDISLVGNYKLNSRWDLNVTWVYFTGMSITVPNISHLNPYYTGKNIFWTEFITPNDVDFVHYTSGKTDYFETRNNYKLPDYHRLDISATLHKITKRNNKTDLTFGITNTYNKLNPSYYLPVKDENSNNDNIIKYETVTLFPILPTITYSLSF